MEETVVPDSLEFWGNGWSLASNFPRGEWVTWDKIMAGVF